ncbi:MAG: hypothetical protein NTY48_05605 [Candidatus Diapherotrites archaeon]|nr:hypothetical protein [Candidatus Diapherotrites archaeon]
MASLKHLGLHQRAKALVLLKNGNSVGQTVQFLQQRYHPTESIEEVKKRYFPATGSFAITKLEHAPKIELLAALNRMKNERDKNKRLAQSPKSILANRERMLKRNQDPEFARANRERGRQLMTALHQNPEFRRKHKVRGSEHMTALHQNPEFERANIERMNKRFQDPAYVKRDREQKLERYKNPAYARAHKRRMRLIHKTAMYKRNLHAGVKRYWAANRSARSMQMILRYQDPLVLEAHKERMREVCKTPAFRRKLLAGVRRRWEIYRSSINEEAEKRGIIQGVVYQKDSSSHTGSRKIIVPATSITPLTNLLEGEKQIIITQAIGELSAEERILVAGVFGFAQQQMGISQTAKWLNKTQKEIKSMLKAILEKLSRNKKLQQLR